MYDGIRQAIVGAVYDNFVADYPQIPFVGDNAPFDRNAPPDSYVEFEVIFQGGAQINLGANPSTRTYGHVYVTAWVREGLGPNLATTVCGWFAERLKYKYLGGATLQAPQPDGSNCSKGWYWCALKVEFHADHA